MNCDTTPEFDEHALKLTGKNKAQEERLRLLKKIDPIFDIHQCALRKVTS